MALSLLAELANLVVMPMIGTVVSWILLEKDGEVPFYIATALGLFVAVSVVGAGWCYPKCNSYRIFMKIYAFVGSATVHFTLTLILKKLDEISSSQKLKLEWVVFGVLTVLAIAFRVHDYLVVDSRFQLELSMFVLPLITLWATRCWNAYGQPMLFFIPAFAVGFGTILIDV